MILGVWLVVVGVCDLLRAARDATSTRRRVLLVVLGTCMLLTAGLLLPLDGHVWWWVILPWIAGQAAWLLTSSVALDPSSQQRGRWRVLAFASFGLPFAGFVLAGDALPTPHAPLSGTLVGDLGLDRSVLLAGIALLQLSTANLLVRLLLDAVGVPAQSHEKDLKGGRVLGPMERLFVLVLAIAGQLTAASVVVAAKGLLRWPELRSPREGGPSEISEYFLIGSFASWLVALGGWLIVRVL
jgi:hypothetical protein